MFTIIIFILQIVSTYSTPDTAELNFHAGVMLRRQLLFQTFFVRHSGVQFTHHGGEDLILAGLVFHLCSYPGLDAANVQVNLKAFSEQLVSFVKGESSELTVQYAEIPFCSTDIEMVDVHCLCRSQWIEGATSLAVYGRTEQKSFNMHICCKCGQWCHKHCLLFCQLKVPKRNQDFICPKWYFQKPFLDFIQIIQIHVLQTTFLQFSLYIVSSTKTF